MAKTSKTTYLYDGPYDAVEVRLPSGRSVTVERGGTVDLLPNEIEAVSQLIGWSKAPSSPATKATPTTDEKDQD